MHLKIDKDAFDLLSGLYASDLLYCGRGCRIGIHRIICNVRLIGQLFRFRNNWSIFRHSSPWGRIIGLKQSSCVFFLVLRPVFTSAKKMAVGDNNQNLYQWDEALRLEGSAQAEKKPFGIFPYGKRESCFLAGPTTGMLFKSKNTRENFVLWQWTRMSGSQDILFFFF